MICPQERIGACVLASRQEAKLEVETKASNAKVSLCNFTQHKPDPILGCPRLLCPLCDGLFCCLGKYFPKFGEYIHSCFFFPPESFVCFTPVFQEVSVLSYLATNTSNHYRLNLHCNSQSQFLVLSIQRKPIGFFFFFYQTSEMTMAVLVWVLRRVTVSQALF